MKAIPLVRVSQLLPVVDFLNQIGSPTDRLLEQVSLTPTTLDHPENLLTIYQGSTLMENAANREGLQTLGFLIGRQTLLDTFGTIGKILNNCLTLFDLLTTMEQLVRLDNSGEHVSFRWEHDSVWWQFHYDYDYLAHGSNLQTSLYGLGMILV
ncbi:AraC family transcriptional regulator ligand-binding domain-containing protein [Nodosilinea sp. LEGE 07298]|uniref:AraC family transcriptional regulator ligand-binding domain-containing protein n=1 Tax=Nodosilinea sp. LEGE 07298 TaxID=2777970 RepID=UPI00187E54B8|nr:AraC family transcriptional regulator ligand-binding domain-containing protein [Nodosilinea sp. LEGE 07298]MBE9112146.1 AraC family transcriptional regulator ligand-binding domain-containing protein [Nodosilinea sp. LEGE 07298]